VHVFRDPCVPLCARVSRVCVPAPPGVFLPGMGTGITHCTVPGTRLSRLELIGGSGRTAGRYASAARAFMSPTAFEQARGGALGAGGGRVGFAGGGLF